MAVEGLLMAVHGGCRQPMCDPEGCSTVWGAVGGGGGGFVDPKPAERGTQVGKVAT